MSVFPKERRFLTYLATHSKYFVNACCLNDLSVSRFTTLRNQEGAMGPLCHGRNIFLFRELFWLGPRDMRQMALNQDWTVELSITYIHQQIDLALQIENKDLLPGVVSTLRQV